MTTKEVGKGTGLGLSLSYGIVQAHGGFLMLDEHHKGGAKFVVKIPIGVCPSVRAEKMAPPEEKQANGVGRILLVDDEEQILECTRLLLEGLEFTVKVASNGEQAKNILAGNQYELVVKEQPELADRIIFVTGDTIAPDIQEFFKKVTNQHIKKPFTGQELTNAINTVMKS